MGIGGSLMPQQTFDFNNAHIQTQTINQYTPEHKPIPESKTSLINFKVEGTEKENTANFCLEQDISVSEFYREAGKLYRKLYPHLSKIEKYWDALISWLERLP